MLFWALVPFVPFCLGANPCPGQPPDSDTGSCRRETFDPILRSSYPEAFVISVNRVPRGGCFGQHDTVDVAPAGQSGVSGNYANNTLVDSCAVIIGNEGYRFGLMLPDASSWNGSFLTVGNNAFSGGITWVDMSAGVNQGLATMSTDTGHNSSSLLTWAKNNETAQRDWGFAAMAGAVPIAKNLTTAYYGTANDGNGDIKHSYYAGCSTGGRQGMVHIQRYPDYFDGVLIGAPAFDQVHLLPWIYKLGLDNQGEGRIDPTTDFGLWTSMLVKARNFCDKKDNVTDNIVSRPDLCKMSSLNDTLQCQNDGDGDCYTPAQIGVLQKLYSDTLDDGTVVYTAPEVDSEWNLFTGYVAASPDFASSWSDNFLDYTPNGTYESLKEMISQAVAKNPGQATADDPDLSAFAARGGKLILYQGLADGVVPPRRTENYWNAMVGQMGSVDSWASYFEVPGMQHCWLSDTITTNTGATRNTAPWMFGGSGHAAIAAQSYPKLSGTLFGHGNPSTDALAAIQAWVEDGTKPNLTATATDNGTRDKWRQRPLCPYPLVAVLKSGAANQEPDMNEAANWTCAER
ncbi:tannase and feruloyl esterase [Xylariaceae sp. FL0016]|nr:tannase and feruloyl esterase [Xylariaceae sp. FL0016]